MYYTVIKHSGHLRTLEKCRKHSPNARRVLSQCNTRLMLLYLLNIYYLLYIYMYIYIYIYRKWSIVNFNLFFPFAFCSVIQFKVKEVQRKISQERFLKKHVRATQKSVVLPDDVNFRCRKCTEFVCQAHDVRRIKGSHHVIINRECRDTKVSSL